MRIMTLVSPIALTIVTGCGVSSSPSSSDAETQIEEIFKNCPSIKLTSFKKINGVASEENKYIINAEFSLSSTPLPENEKLLSELNNKHAEQRPEFDRTIAEYNELKSKAESLADVIDKKQVARGLDKLGDEEDMALTKERHQIFENINSYATAHESFWFEYANFNSNTEARILTIYNNNFSKKCKFPQNSTFTRRLINNLLPNRESFAEKKEATFTADIPMIKTDNGWVIEDLWRK